MIVEGECLVEYVDVVVFVFGDEDVFWGEFEFGVYLFQGCVFVDILGGDVELCGLVDGVGDFVQIGVGDEVVEVVFVVVG